MFCLFKKPRFIFMDWDNTVVDTDVVCRSVFNKLLKTLNIDRQVSLNEVIIMNNKKFRNVFHDYFPDFSEEERGNLIKKYEEIYKIDSVDLLKPIKNVEIFLTFLKEQDIKVAILSNKPHRLLIEEAKRLKLDKYFDSIQGIEDGIEEKPDLDLYKITCTRLGIANEEICNFKSRDQFFFGDTKIDIEFAKNCRMIGVFVGPFINGEKDCFLTKYHKDIQDKNLILLKRDYLYITKQFLLSLKKYYSELLKKYQNKLSTKKSKK